MLHIRTDKKEIKSNSKNYSINIFKNKLIYKDKITPFKPKDFKIDSSHSNALTELKQRAYNKEDTHTRRTFLINNNLIDWIDQTAESIKYKVFKPIL